MIILPENTVKTWGEAVTSGDWLNLSNALMAHALTAHIEGKLEVCDDWRMLSDLAWQHSIDVMDRIERRLEAA